MGSGSSYIVNEEKLTRRRARVHTSINAWIRGGFFDLAELMSEIPGLRVALYTSAQHHYRLNWEDIKHILQKERETAKSRLLKRLIRRYSSIRGIPDAHISEYFFQLFSYKELKYASLLKAVFPTGPPEDFSQVPTFSEHIQLDKAVYKLYLTPEGKKALSRVMWVLSNHGFSFEYNPQVVNLASLLLIYMGEDQTFEILAAMIKKTSKTESLVTKIFLMNQKEIGLTAGIIKELIKHKCEELIEYVGSIRINFDDVIADILSTLGIGYFPLTTLTRILVSFAVEGNKALIKVITASFLIFADIIIAENPVDLQGFLRKRFNSIPSPDVFYKRAFKIRLSKYSFSEVVSNLTKKAAIQLYRPVANCEFDPVTEETLEKIWFYLPQLVKGMRATGVYSSKTDGISLHTLYRKAADYPSRTPMLLIITTDEKWVFGAFLDCAMQTYPAYIGNSNSFVFLIEPSVQIFYSTNKNSMFAYITDDFISFGGGGHGPALCIDDQLIVGQSYISDTFDNIIFDRGLFNIVSCEVIGLIV